VIFQVVTEGDGSYAWGRHWIERITRAGYLALHNPAVDKARYLDDPRLTFFAFHGEAAPHETNRYTLDRYAKGKIIVNEEQTRHPYDVGSVLHLIWGSLLASGTYVWDWDTAPDAPGLNLAMTLSAGAAAFFRQAAPDYRAMRPRNDRVRGAGYCAAVPGREYIVYTWQGASLDVELGDAPAATVFDALWFNPQVGGIHARFTAQGGARRTFAKPDAGTWVLFLRAQAANPNPNPNPNPGPGTGTGRGLKGEYLGPRAFALFGQQKRLTRVDPTIDFSWGAGSPDPGIARDLFTGIWTGQVEAPTTEVYTFTTLSDDGVRLHVDGRLLIDNWTPHAATENSGAIALVAGRKYDIRLEYFEGRGQAVLRLSWQTPTRARAVVPAPRLYPAP
jgi:hypothetical protein